MAIFNRPPRPMADSGAGECLRGSAILSERTDLDDFVACYNPKDRHERKETDRFNPDQSGANRFERVESERFWSFTYEKLVKRDP